MHVQSWCFAQQTYCFFDVLVAVAVVVAKAPYYLFGAANSQVPSMCNHIPSASQESLSFL